jgi:hypothetical protein
MAGFGASRSDRDCCLSASAVGKNRRRHGFDVAHAPVHPLSFVRIRVHSKANDLESSRGTRIVFSGDQ